MSSIDDIVINLDLEISVTQKKLMPEGLNQVEIKSTQMKVAKSGNGEYLSVEFYNYPNNARAWSNFNLINTSERAQSIAVREFTKLLKALDFTGNFKASNHSTLVGKSLVVKVVHEVTPLGNKEARVVEFLPSSALPFQSGHATGGESDLPF